MAKAITLGVTIGDPSGIGAEIVVKALTHFKKPVACNVVIFGDRSVLARAGFSPRKINAQIVDPHCIGVSDVRFGVLSKENGMASYRYLQDAVKALKDKTIDCIVTAPVNKKAISLNAIDFVGHTEFLADSFGVNDVVMFFASRKLKVSLVTRHCSLRNVFGQLTAEKISHTVGLTYDALQHSFAVKTPRIAVLGLNPHASDGGLLGSEEKDVILPALDLLKTKYGIKEGIFGPLSPDTVFNRALRGDFDAVVCMYHDQALIPFKMLYFNEGVNVTLGLPFVRTSCVYGTAFDIAGKGKADYRSMLEAIELAYRMAKNKRAA